MRRLILVLAALVAAACASGSPTGPLGSGQSALPTTSGQASIGPTGRPTSSVAPADTSTWIELAPIGQRFAVAIPDKPASTRGSVGNPPAATTFWTYTDPNGRVFQVARSRLPVPRATPTPRPSEPVPSPTPGSPLGFADTILESLEGGTIAATTPVTIDGRPGIRYSAQSENLRSEGLLVIDKWILYRVSVTYDVTRPDDAAVLGFLGSFTLMA